MVFEVDRNSTRQRNQKKYNEGRSLDSKIAEWKSPSGGKVFIAGKVGILAKVKLNKQDNKKKEREAKEKASIEHANLVREAELIKEKMTKANKALNDLTIDQLRPLLKALKHLHDKAIPTIKVNMVQ